MDFLRPLFVLDLKYSCLRNYLRFLFGGKIIAAAAAVVVLYHIKRYREVLLTTVYSSDCPVPTAHRFCFCFCLSALLVPIVDGFFAIESSADACRDFRLRKFATDKVRSIAR